MKRITLLIASVLCLLSLLITTAFAHPGGTDSRGGHTNHSTGEYHYHHGYSAHDHTDMDGDGTLDCPYEFKDNTSNNSVEDIDLSLIEDFEDIKFEPGMKETVEETQEVKQEVKKEVKKEVKTETQESKISGLEVFDCLLRAVAIWLFSSYFFSWIFMAAFGSDQGCSISVIVGAIVAVFAFICFIVL